ncbi:MAG: DUF805 domain-containing protein [Clostridiales Family XIII bacterium]|jgi:uncharacterized membrane protein YhaH (DUF805 family)|nr:DUF805 domain-containing protein [Clostridiales Family XIII bacterium]
MLESYKLYWKNYVNFRGRTPRRGYWWVQLWNVIIYFGLSIILTAVIMSEGASVLGYMSYNPSDFTSFGTEFYLLPRLLIGSGGAIAVVFIIYAAFIIANIIPSISLSIRRLHDTGRRWYYMLMLCLPEIVMLVMTLIVILSATLDAIVVAGVVMLICYIAGAVCTIIWIVIMCKPTSPNAIGYSTHDDYGYQGYGTTEAGIIGLSGMYANVTFPIESYEELVIGRDAAFSHVVIDTNAEKISRKHVSVGYDASERMYVVTDFSSNGTYMNNGTRLTANVAMKLPAGSVIYLAKPDNSFRLA